MEERSLLQLAVLDCAQAPEACASLGVSSACPPSARWIIEGRPVHTMPEAGLQSAASLLRFAKGWSRANAGSAKGKLDETVVKVTSEEEWAAVVEQAADGVTVSFTAPFCESAECAAASVHKQSHAQPHVLIILGCDLQARHRDELRRGC
jgi:hypothetical protein